MDEESTGTYTSAKHQPPSITLQELQQEMLRFTDRMPAILRAIKVHPDYLDVFMGNLQEEGFRKVSKLDCPAGLAGIQIVPDAEVPFGEHRLVYVGDPAPCSCCGLPIDTSDPEHKLPCGCVLCSICLDRGRRDNTALFCKHIASLPKTIYLDNGDVIV